jgi:hypothetical protein
MGLPNVAPEGGVVEEVGIEPTKACEFSACERGRNVMVCSCVGIEFGSYDAAIPMRTAQGRMVAVDVCIATEIGRLWMHGVVTVGSCCGHGQMQPTVVVAAESIPKMRELGYENWKVLDDQEDVFVLTGKMIPVPADNPYCQAWKRDPG